MENRQLNRDNEMENVSIIILAAGLGTRMKSNMAKVLHRIMGKPMISHVLASACDVARKDVIVVVGHQAGLVKEACLKVSPVSFAIQKEQRGTGHAVLCAMPEVPETVQNVIILCGDVPLLRAGTIQALLDDHIKENRDLSLLAVKLKDPTGYGRVVINADRELTRIVEEADATADEKKISLVNSGIYCAKNAFLSASLQKISPDNAQGEFYLTDIIGVGYSMGNHIGVLVGSSPEEVSGVNTPADLKAVEALMESRLSRE
jgi:UDP-N-acetylglucosamine diphosphorylase/glucosamine-1-phosphate N-acetyltransferase